MTIEECVRSSELRCLGRQGPLGPYLDALISHAGKVGYTDRSLRDLVAGAIQFGAFLTTCGIVDLRELRACHVDDFIATVPLYRCQVKYEYRFSRGVRGAKYVLRYALAAGLVPAAQPPEPPLYAPLLDEWLSFLEHHRGLTQKSIAQYRRLISRFLEFLGSDANVSGIGTLNVERIRTYLQAALQDQGRSERKSIVCTLRLFLRFVWDRGYLALDLSIAVQRVPSFKEERLQRGPRWEDAQRLPESTDRSTTLGRRDFAILLMLLTYGVRAMQVCRLRLDDVDWRHQTLRFAPLKRGRAIEVPLLPDIGDALLDYLREGRPTTSYRQLFLGTRPPIRPLTTSAITSLTTRAFARAGVSSPHYGSHALRHAWATRLLAQGSTLKTIADLIGHRSVETTRIYAKVDTVRLRTVGLPWPEEVVS